VRHLSVSELLPQTDDYLTYEGSMLQPGCHETITWVIMNKPIYISPENVRIQPFCFVYTFYIISKVYNCLNQTVKRVILKIRKTEVDIIMWIQISNILRFYKFFSNVQNDPVILNFSKLLISAFYEVLYVKHCVV